MEEIATLQREIAAARHRSLEGVEEHHAHRIPPYYHFVPAGLGRRFSISADSFAK